MKLNQFLRSASDENFLQQTRIINLILPGQPSVLFLQAFIARIKALTGKQLIRLHPDQQSHAEIQAALATSFLGNSFFYAIGTELAKSETQLLTFLESYQGIHTVLVATKQEFALRERPDVLHIFLDEMLDVAGYGMLYSFLNPGSVADKRFIQELFRRLPQIGMDTASLLMHYQHFVGKNHEEFFSVWFDRIVEQKQSLFTLSQYLFARDGKNFYNALHSLAAEYPVEFWLAFWAEQLWQAIIFVMIAQKDGALVAKRSVSRLPFSFMQKDWQKHSPQELVHAHDMLYVIDCANKNGSVVDGLDVWYAKFFT